MLYAIVLKCMSVCPSVRVFTITQERLDVEWWNLAHIHLRSRVKSSSKMGHVHDLWPGHIEDFHNSHSKCMQDGIVYCTVYMCNVHVPIPVEYLSICATGVYFHYPFHSSHELSWESYTIYIFIFIKWIEKRSCTHLSVSVNFNCVQDPQTFS